MPRGSAPPTEMWQGTWAWQVIQPPTLDVSNASEASTQTIVSLPVPPSVPTVEGSGSVREARRKRDQLKKR
ncbi:UNVERIFIED_CONTAM: hypothetical protein Sangu_1446700 [Sesamum angustifolium]|uniref:Uncharacterized protein n=1 Tax=Sesamum angustifolium TaxID=2727405 RepID=A0AAW2NA08_9LAMI